MRDFLAHHYFAARPDIIQLTLDKRLPVLESAVARIQETHDAATTPPTPR